MATYYEDFTPTIVSNQLMMNRDKDCVFKNICYKGPYLGEIKNMGDVLHIPGTGDPTVAAYTPNSDITLYSGNSYKTELRIDKFYYVNEQLDKVDNKQAAGEIFAKRMTRAKQMLAENMDTLLAGVYSQVDTSGDQYIQETACTSANILSTLVQASTKLAEANVPQGAPKYLVISPAIYEKLILAKIVFQNPNKDAFGAGFIGQFLDLQIFVSNSIQKTVSVNHCLAMSGEGIALAEQILPGTAEVYQPEKRFASAFKALHVFGFTVLRANELIRLDITPTTESVA